MKLLLAVLVLVVGMLLPVQAAMNAAIRRAVGHPLWGGLWNFVVGLVLLSIAALVLGLRPTAIGKLSDAPTWSLWGGVLGAALVITSLMAAPRLGATLMIACLVAGQLASSVLLDHMGWLGYPQHPVNVGRMVGVCLLAAGAWLVRVY